MNDPLKMQGRRLFRVGPAALFLVAAAAAFYPPIRGHYAFAAPKSRAGGPPHVAAEDSTTTLSDETDLAVTVYNSNIALVRDVRQLALPSGTLRLKFMDIAATVNPATVHFRSLNEPDKVGVIEQNYEYDLLEPAKLLHKYVGRSEEHTSELQSPCNLVCRLLLEKKNITHN